MILTREFFDRPTIDVAKDLLGAELFFYGKSGIITETEAYIGQDDPACHAANGRTKRTEPMFGQPGFSYVYLIYGMYHCLNFVTEQEGFPAAVLIRAIEIDGVNKKETNGPGKICRYLGITTEHNKTDLIGNKNFHIKATGHQPNFITTTRIGISKGQEKLWRFVAKK